MSLNDFRLPPSLVAKLYKKVFVEVNPNEIVHQTVTGEKATTLEKPALKKSLGNNKKNILIVVDYQDITHLPDEELDFLSTILTACKLTLDDVAIVNRKNFPGDNYKNFISNYSSKIVLLFGISPDSFGLPVDFPPFQVQSFANCTFLYSPSMEERKNDSLYKSKLWVCLRRIFGV
jgi:hypothetical protein